MVSFKVGKRSFSKEAEEEQYRDILLFMQLLTNLLSKDFIDLSPPESQAAIFLPMSIMVLGATNLHQKSGRGGRE